MSSTNSRDRLVQSVISSLRGLDTELDLMNQAVAEATGFNRTDAQAMDIITAHAPITPGALAERLGLTAGAVTTILDRLEGRGYIVRQHDTRDRRRVLVAPNQAKLRRVRRLFSGLQRATRRLAQRYSDEQLLLAVEFLQRTSGIVAEHRKGVRQKHRQRAE